MKVASVIWQDASGATRQTIIRTSGGVGDVLIALQYNSWARVMEFWEGDKRGPLGIASAQPYQQVGSAVTLLFQTASGNLVKVTLPAPDVVPGVNPHGIFKADLLTVDPATIAPLIAAVIANVVDITGNPVTTYLGGTLQRTRLDLPATQ